MLSIGLVRRLGLAIIYVAYLALALVAFAYAFHFFHVRDLRSRDRTQPDLDALEIDPSLARKVGLFENQQRSSYLRFEREKPSGVIRIGCLGDSFTRGNEVGSDRDYPTLLQEQFDRSGYENVQVLNFGSSFHGFHQNFFVWEDLAQDYDLDYVLLGPASFQPRRDTRFNHSDGKHPYYLHARFILTQDDVALVEIIGDDRDDRFEHYYRFIPHLRYLRYGREVPSFLAALIPKGRTLPNPFYYSELSEEDEAYETYARLLAKMTEDDAQFVVAHYDEPIVDLASRLDRDNVTTAKLERRMTFPHLAANFHDAPTGNFFVAESFFRILTRDGTPLKVVATSDALEAFDPSTDARALHAYEHIYVAIEDGPEGYFIGTNNQSQTHLMERQVASLLGFRFTDEVALDAFFLPLPVPLAVPEIEASGFDLRKFGPNIGVVTLERGRRDLRRPWRLVVHEEDLASVSNLASLHGVRFEVEEDDNPSYRLLLPDANEWIRISADETRLFDPKRAGGSIWLVLEADEAVERIPVAHWRWIDYPPPIARIQRPIERPRLTSQ